MSVDVGSEIAIEIEKPAAGGWMLARHEGQVVLVRGAIPGERVCVRIDRIGKGVVYADTVEVLLASPDRRPAAGDPACGGNVFAHIAYERQRALKGEILRDALARIGRLSLPSAPDVLGSPERGYRMRARLHAQGAQLGFLREGTHQLCDVASTSQLLPDTGDWIAAAEAVLLRDRLEGLTAIEIAENIPGNERACHLQLQAGVDAARFVGLADAGPLNGISAEREDRAGVERLEGIPSVSDVLHVRAGDPASALRLRRDVRAFFQANRFLVEPLVRHVVALVPPGPVVDLYAGVGLFGLSLAAGGVEDVTLVEGDSVSGASLQDNAEPFGPRVSVERRSVESFLRGVGGRGQGSATFIVDPPRTGMSKEALRGIVRMRPGRIIYVSCDVATFARDTRTLVDAGYALDQLTGIDLFPNTAHVEAVAAYSRSI